MEIIRKVITKLQLLINKSLPSIYRIYLLFFFVHNSNIDLVGTNNYINGNLHLLLKMSVSKENVWY